MGAFRLLSAIQRLVGRREDETEFEFKPLNNRGVRLFSSNTVLAITYEPGLTFKDVCENAAREVGILPINIPFFSLVTVNGGHVMNLQKTLTEQECKENYEFRLVFKGCHASWFADKSCFDENALVYLFHQCRHDFLKDPTKLEFTESENDSSISKEDINKCFVKAVLCEIVYQARENDVKASHVLGNVRHYKIKHLLQRGLFAKRELREVRSYLKKPLGNYEKLGQLKLKKEFLNCTEHAKDYFVHKYHVNKIETNYVAKRTQNVSYELLISAQFGIKKKRIHRDDSEHEKHAEVIVESFREVSQLEIDQVDGNRVTICRTNATPQVLLAQSKEDAQSIVAIIDGYYKLLVNRYKVLINQGRSFPVKFHGPIKRQRAVSKIQEHGTKDGLFLIRKSRDKYDQYSLSLYCNKKCEHYQVLQENGEYFIKDTIDKFKDLNDLVNHYKKHKGGLVCCLTKNCPPSNEGFDALLDNQQDVPTSERPQDLSQFGEYIDLKTITELTAIGQGEYGMVIKAEWIKNIKELPVDVVVRKVARATYAEDFFEEGKRLMTLKNPNVIRCHGIVRMKHELGIVFEFAAQPLDGYLIQKIKSNYGTLTMKTVTQYSIQIAAGMMYLQEMKFVHGRLCAHNVLVPSDPSNVKISDVGLSDLKNHGAQFCPGNKTSDRHCWHAPELLVSPNTNPTHESDIWSLGVTLWEIFTLKKPFYRADDTCLTREEVLNVLTMREQYLDTESDSIPKPVADIIQNCWHRRPEERKNFRNTSKELRNVLVGDENQQALKRPLVQDKNSVESWEADFTPKDNTPVELAPATDSSGYSTMKTDKSRQKKLAPGSQNVTSHSCSNLEFIPRKESVFRTNSDPGSPTNGYEDLTDKFKSLLLRPQSSSLLQGTMPDQKGEVDESTPDTLDDGTADNQGKLDNAVLHDQDIASDAIKLVPFDGECTFQDTAQSPSATQDPPFSASSVEVKAMDFLRELSSQQKMKTSLDLLPSASPTVCTAHDQLQVDSTSTKGEQKDLKKHDSNVGFVSEQKKTKQKNTIDHHLTPQTSSSDDDNAEPYIAEDSLRNFVQFHMGDIQGCHVVGLQGHNETHTPTDYMPQDLLHQQPDNVHVTPLPQNSSHENVVTELMLGSGKSEKENSENGGKIESEGSSGYVDHPSTSEPNSLSECHFTDENVPSNDNTETTDYNPIPMPECPFMTSSDNSINCFDHPPTLQQSSMPHPLFGEDHVSTDAHMGYVDHSSTTQEISMPQSPFGEDHVSTDAHMGYVDQSDTTQQISMPQSPFGEDHVSTDAHMGYVDQSDTTQQISMPQSPFGEDHVSTDAHMGYVDQPLTTQQSSILHSPFGEDHATTGEHDHIGYVDQSPTAQQISMPHSPIAEDHVGEEHSDQKMGHQQHPVPHAGQKRGHQPHNIPDTGQKQQKRGYQPPAPGIQEKTLCNPSMVASPQHTNQDITKVPAIRNQDDKNDAEETASGSSAQATKQKKGMPTQRSFDDIKNEVEKKFIIDKQNLTWGDRLGKGQFGVVYKGILSEVRLGSKLPKKKDVAIKELLKTADNKSHEDFINEAINMSKLAVQIRSEHIIKFIGVCIGENESKAMIITELAPFGNLEVFLTNVKKKGDTFRLPVLVDFCVQICNGMKDLESEDVLHRDLALRNILVVKEDPFLLKISDFGLSRLSEYYKSEGGKFPLRWYAPESISHLRFTSKSDVWSFGVAMWEVFSYGDQPYAEIIDSKMIIHHISKGNRLPKPDNCPEDIYTVMRQCWDYDPQSRPPFYELSGSLLDIKNKYCGEEQ